MCFIPKSTFWFGKLTVLILSNTYLLFGSFVFYLSVLNVFFFFTKVHQGKNVSVYLSLIKIGGFLVNPENLELFNNTSISENVTNFYLTELFEFTPTFNPLR